MKFVTNLGILSLEVLQASRPRSAHTVPCPRLHAELPPSPTGHSASQLFDVFLDSESTAYFLLWVSPHLLELKPISTSLAFTRFIHPYSRWLASSQPPNLTWPPRSHTLAQVVTSSPTKFILAPAGGRRISPPKGTLLVTRSRIYPPR